MVTAKELIQSLGEFISRAEIMTHYKPVGMLDQASAMHAWLDMKLLRRNLLSNLFRFIKNDACLEVIVGIIMPAHF